MSRQTARQKARAAVKQAGRPMVHLAIPDEWVDCMGQTWLAGKRNGIVEELDLVGALLESLHRMPVRNGADAERTLDLLTLIREGGSDFIVVPKDDYDWFKAHMLENLHTVWLAPDSAKLIRYWVNNVKEGSAPPPGDGDKGEA